MTVALVALTAVVIALLVDRQVTARQFASERRDLIAAALARSAGEFAAATRPGPKAPAKADPSDNVRPMVGM